MIAGVAVRDSPDLNKDEIVVGLSNVSPGSLRLRFGSPPPQATPVLAGFMLIAAAVQAGRFGELPNSSLRALGQVASFTKRHDCQAEFYASGSASPVAVVTPTVDVPPPQLVPGETTLYGKVIRVGGRRPRIMVETLSGEVVYCDTTEDLAKELAQRLYQFTRLEGLALWDPDEWLLDEFTVTAIGEQAGARTPAAALELLRELIGGYYANVADPVRYVSGLRGDGEQV